MCNIAVYRLVLLFCMLYLCSLSSLHLLWCRNLGIRVISRRLWSTETSNGWMSTGVFVRFCSSCFFKRLADNCMQRRRRQDKTLVFLAWSLNIHLMKSAVQRKTTLLVAVMDTFLLWLLLSLTHGLNCQVSIQQSVHVWNPHAASLHGLHLSFAMQGAVADALLLHCWDSSSSSSAPVIEYTVWFLIVLGH